MATAMQPMGPAPVMSTSSPTRSKERAVWVALPKGSRNAATRRRCHPAAGRRSRREWRGIRAKQPGRFTPTPTVLRQRCRRPGAAVAAMAAGDVAFARDPIAGLEALHLGADLRHHAHDTRGRRPWAPGWSSAPTHPSCRCACRCRRWRSCDLDEQVVVADLGLRHVLQPDAGLPLLALTSAFI